MSIEAKKLREVLQAIFKTFTYINRDLNKKIFHYLPIITHKKHSLGDLPENRWKLYLSAKFQYKEIC